MQKCFLSYILHGENFLCKKKKHKKENGIHAYACHVYVQQVLARVYSGAKGLHV